MSTAPRVERTGRDLATLTAMSPWYAEDLGLGDWMDLGDVTVSRDEIVEFAARYDPLPIHVDGTDSRFGDVIASGMHIMALYSSLASRQYVPRLALVAGKGIDRLRLPNPVLPGAILTGASDIVTITMRRDRADVHSLSTLVDQDGRVVLSFIGIIVVDRRCPAAEEVSTDSSTGTVTTPLPQEDESPVPR